MCMQGTFPAKHYIINASFYSKVEWIGNFYTIQRRGGNEDLKICILYVCKEHISAPHIPPFISILPND